MDSGCFTGNSFRSQRTIALLLALLLLVCVRVARANESVQQVLVLNSYHQELPWTQGFIDGLRSAVNESSVKWQLYFENMDSSRTNKSDDFLINKPQSWLTQNYHYVLWGFGLTALLAIIGFVWAARLKAANSRLTELNEYLIDSQRDLEVTNFTLKKQSMVDPLTSLFNRRAMLPLLREAIYECSRYQTVSSLMLLDLDNFKSINDLYGHNCGDHVLEAVSETLSRETRISDSLARWGGEEFLILAKATPLPEAAPFAENIRDKIESLHFDFGIKVTISIGICAILPDLSIEQLLEKADEAMYQAKEQGRNRIVIAGN